LSILIRKELGYERSQKFVPVCIAVIGSYSDYYLNPSLVHPNPYMRKGALTPAVVLLLREMTYLYVSVGYKSHIYPGSLSVRKLTTYY